MQYTIIAALAKNRVIGNKGKIPWDIPEDRKRFRKLTTPHPIIMGRATYESLQSMPLKNRQNIIISGSLRSSSQRLFICRTLESALSLAQRLDDIAFITGGEQVYRQTIRNPRVTCLELTEIHESYEGDAFFPEFNPGEWSETSRLQRDFYDFVTYRRR